MAASDFRAGVVHVAPMLVGVVPFGLVAGASPVAQGLGGGAPIGLSVIVFAGASQLAAADVLGGGGSVLVATLAAWTINLRMLLYSASVAQYFAHEPLRRRLVVAYLLTDQAFALTVTGYGASLPPARRFPYYLGAAMPLWVSWQVCTVLGVLVGAAVPEGLPLDFAVPLVFLVLLVPAITSRPAVVAAGVGAVVAVVAGQAGAGPLGVMAGALSGIAAGTVADVAGGPKTDRESEERA